MPQIFQEDKEAGIFRFRLLAVSWFARIKIYARVGSDKSVRPTRKLQALRRGLTVKSLTWVRMLDICIPFSCETKGIISAMNGSFINSLISS